MSTNIRELVETSIVVRWGVVREMGGGIEVEVGNDIGKAGA